MATLLLIVIYIAFIGLGIPDSLFGAAWSAIAPDLGVPISYAGFVTVLVSGCTVFSSVMSSRLLARFSTRTITAVSTAMTAVALLGYSISPGLWCMCLFAVVLGLGAGAIDAALNNYIALYYSAMHMNFLHCFYGVGVTTSPYIMSLMLKNATWRVGYLNMSVVQAVIAGIAIMSIPLWTKVRQSRINNEEEIEQTPLSFFKMAKMRSVRFIWIICIATNAIEAMLGIWGSSFLVHSHAMTAAAAAKAIVFYYAGLAVGRFFSGLVSVKFNAWKIIFICIGITFLGIVLLFIPVPLIITVGFFVVGFGNGPIYPNIMHLTPENFGKNISGAMIGSQMAFAYTGFTIAPALFGVLTNVLPVGIFPVYVLVCFFILIGFIPLFLKEIK